VRLQALGEAVAFLNVVLAIAPENHIDDGKRSHSGILLDTEN